MVGRWVAMLLHVFTGVGILFRYVGAPRIIDKHFVTHVGSIKGIKGAFGCIEGSFRHAVFLS